MVEARGAVGWHPRRTASLGMFKTDDVEMRPVHRRERSADHGKRSDSDILTDTKMSLAKWFCDRLLGTKTLSPMRGERPELLSVAREVTAEATLPFHVRKSASSDGILERTRFADGTGAEMVDRAVSDCLAQSHVCVGIVGTGAEAVIDCLLDEREKKSADMEMSSGSEAGLSPGFLNSRQTADGDMDMDIEASGSTSIMSSFQYAAAPELVVQLKPTKCFPNVAYVDEGIKAVLGRAVRYQGRGEDVDSDRLVLEEVLADLRANFGPYIESCVVRLPCPALAQGRELVYYGGLECAQPEQSLAAMRRTNCLVCVVEEEKGLTHNLRGFLVRSGFLERLFRSPSTHRLSFLIKHSGQAGLGGDSPLTPVLSAQVEQLLREHAPPAHMTMLGTVLSGTRFLTVAPEAYLSSSTEQKEASGMPEFLASVCNFSITLNEDKLRLIAEDWRNQAAKEPSGDCMSDAHSGVTAVRAKAEKPCAELPQGLQQGFTLLRGALAKGVEVLHASDETSARPTAGQTAEWETMLLSAVPRHMHVILQTSHSLFTNLIQSAVGEEVDASARLEQVKLNRLRDFCANVQKKTQERAAILAAALIPTPRDRQVTVAEKADLKERLNSGLHQVGLMEKELRTYLNLALVALRAQPQALQKTELSGLLRQKRRLLLSTRSSGLSMTDIPFVPAPNAAVGSTEAWALVAAHQTSSTDPSRPLACSTPEKLRYQCQLLTTTLLSAGLTVGEEASGPWSFFVALCIGMYGTADLTSAVALLVLARVHRMCSGLLPPGTPVDAYVRRMATKEAPADHVVLQAAAECFGAAICVFCPRFAGPLVFRPRSQPAGCLVRVAYLDGLTYREVVAAPLPALRQKRPRPAVVEPSQVAKKTRMAPLPVPAASPVPKVAMSLKDRATVSLGKSLQEMCVASIVQNADCVPALGGSLPFALVQDIVRQCIALGRMSDPLLLRLLSGSSPDTLDLSGYRHGGPALASLAVSELEEVYLKRAKLTAPDFLFSLARNAPGLRVLDLRFCHPIDGKALAAVLTRCLRLEYLNLSGTDVSDELVAVALRLPHLRHLVLRECPRVTDAPFASAAQLPSLTSLDVREAAGVTDVGVSGVARRCCLSLRSLKASGTAVSDTSAEAIGSCKELRAVQLVGTSITDRGIYHLADGCRQLRKLKVPGSKRLTCFAMQQLSGLGALGHLSHLDLGRCLGVNDEVLEALEKICPPLVSLSLNACEDVGDEALAALVAYCGSSLRTLVVSKCPAVSDVAIGSVAEHCANLRSISLYNCAKVTDEAVAELGRSCPALTHVDLSSCALVSGEGVASLVAGAVQLEELALEESSVTDEALLQVVASSRELKSLRLAYCARLTDASVRRLGALCPKLEALDLSHTTRVSLAAVRTLLKGCRGLKKLNLRGYNDIGTEGIRHLGLSELNLSWCKNLEDSAVIETAKNCPSLGSLDLAWCNRLTRPALLRLAIDCKSLSCLNVSGCAGLQE